MRPKLYWALFFNKETNDACYEQITFIASDTLIETHLMHGKEYFMILNCYESINNEFYIKSVKFLDKEIYTFISIDERN